MCCNICEQLSTDPMAGKSSQHLRSLHSARKMEKENSCSCRLQTLQGEVLSKMMYLTKRQAKEVQFLETIFVVES